MNDEFRRQIYATIHRAPVAALNLAELAVRDGIER
jgi:hypothetical protein